MSIKSVQTLCLIIMILVASAAGVSAEEYGFIEVGEEYGLAQTQGDALFVEVLEKEGSWIKGILTREASGELFEEMHRAQEEEMFVDMWLNLEKFDLIITDVQPFQ